MRGGQEERRFWGPARYPTLSFLNMPHPSPLPPPPSALPLSPLQIGSVIRNPEVQALVPHLLAAIAEPNVHTRACLDVLLQVRACLDVLRQACCTLGWAALGDDHSTIIPLRFPAHNQLMAPSSLPPV